jgi:hypothetical protein
MFGSAGKTPAINDGFRGMRGRDDDDDEEEDVTPGLKTEAISLDQVGPFLISVGDRLIICQSGPTNRYKISIQGWASGLSQEGESGCL